MVESVVVYSNKYLAIAEMVKALLKESGLTVVVRARDPFGAFTSGPHLATYQPTPLSVYEVLVPSDQAEEAREIVEGMDQDHLGER